MPRQPVCSLSVAGSRPRARRHRYWIGAALGALALASPLVIAAAPAAAQGIQFDSVGGDGSGDLAVTVTSDYQLTDWTLSLSDGTSTYTMDDFADFTDTSAPFTAGQPQTYVLTQPSDLEAADVALPPGDYTVTATAATDSNGDTLPSPQTITNSNFGFLAQPTVALSSPTFNTTKPDQPVTISGQITGCATLACPAGGWPVGVPVTVTNVSAAGTPPTWPGATTDTSGDFSVSDVTGVPGDKYTASVPAISGTSVLATAPSDTQDVPQYAQTSITATAKPAAYGTQSVKGQLTYQPPSGFTPVAAPAGVQITATAGPHKVSTTTGSDGDFSLALPAITGTTTWLISSAANDLDSTPFLAGTEYSIIGTQLWPVKLSFSASLNKYEQLTLTACMSPIISQRPPADDPTIDFYWRSGRSGAWHWLGSSATSSAVPGCAGFGFNNSGEPPAPSAYYRADFLGDDVYAPAVSASTGRVWSYPTRFQEFRATPRSVKAGHKVTISGILQYQAGNKWRSYGHEPVVLLFAPTRKPKKWLEPVGESVRTNSKGAFSWTFTDTSTDYWTAYYAGNDRHFVVMARPIPVRVHGSASSKRVLLGQPVSLPNTALSALNARGSTWPFVLSADPWLVLMGD